jgi:hypothetical protein
METEKKAARVPSFKRAGLSKAARDLLSRVKASTSPVMAVGSSRARAGLVPGLVVPGTAVLRLSNRAGWRAGS